MFAAAAALAVLLAAGPESALTVVLDPGHGGDQDGALSPTGLKEKDLALQIAERVRARLQQAGVRVVMTRTADQSVPLVNRAEVANGAGADAFISIHLNSMATVEGRRRMRGVETYFMSPNASDARATAVAARENADRMATEPDMDPDDPVAGILSDLSHTESLRGSSHLAYGIHERLVSALRAEDHGVKQAPFFVLAGARMPAVLLEVGFISQPEEAARLASAPYQERIAGAIAAGVLAFRTETAAARR